MASAFILLTLLGLNQDPGSLQSDRPSAQSIIEQYIRAKGGREALRKVKNYIIKGKVISNGQKVGEFEIYQAPNLHLSIDTFPDRSTRTHGTDGKIAWQIDRDGRPTVLTGQSARDYIRHYSTLHEALEWTKQYKAIEYAGITSFKDKPVHHLVFRATDGRKISRFFDVKSGLFVREEQTLADENKTPMVSEIADYVREKNGSLVSRQRINHIGANTVEYKIHSVAANQITDMEIFAVPASVAELQQNTQHKNAK